MRKYASNCGNGSKYKNKKEKQKGNFLAVNYILDKSH